MCMCACVGGRYTHTSHCPRIVHYRAWPFVILLIDTVVPVEARRCVSVCVCVQGPGVKFKGGGAGYFVSLLVRGRSPIVFYRAQLLCLVKSEGAVQPI
jgi:hypothetical protein